MARTAEEIQDEIDEINVALSFIRKAGQSYVINAGASGTSRTVTNADYENLRIHRDDLKRELDTVNGDSTIIIRAGW